MKIRGCKNITVAPSIKQYLNLIYNIGFKIQNVRT